VFVDCRKSFLFSLGPEVLLRGEMDGVELRLLAPALGDLKELAVVGRWYGSTEIGC